MPAPAPGRKPKKTGPSARSSHAENRTQTRPHTIAPQIPAWLTSPYLPLAFIAIYTLVWGAFSIGFWTAGGYGVETDAFGAFLPEVRKMMQGEFTPLDGFKGPGYHLAVAAVSLVARDLFLSAKLVALVSSGVVLWLLFGLVQRSLGVAAAWLTIVFIALNAQFVLFTVQVGTDMFFLALVVGASVLLLERAGWPRALAAGLVVGLAYLARYNGVFLILAGVVVLAFADRREVSQRDRFLRAAAFLIGSTLVFLPWSVFTWSRGQGFFYNANYLNVAYEMFGRDVVSWDQFWEFFNPAFTSFPEVIGADPGKFASMVLKNSFQHLWWDMRRVLVSGDAPWVVPVAALWLVIIAYGLVRVLMVKGLKCWPALLLGFLAYGTLIPVFYGERFSLPLVPAYATLTAAAVTLSFGQRNRSFGLAAIPLIFALILLWAGVASTRAEIANLLESQPTEIKAIAKQVKNQFPEGGAVLARKPHIAYFTGLDFVRMPFLEKLEDLPGIARRARARYLFVSGIEAAMRPPLTPLTGPGNAPPFLKPIASVGFPAPAVLYQFNISIPEAETPAAKGVAPPSPQARLPQKVRLGRAYLNAGRVDLAAEWFQKASSEDPTEPAAILGLIQLDEVRLARMAENSAASGLDREQLERLLDGIEQRLTALAAAAPASADVQRALGEFLVRRGRLGQAIPRFRTLLQQNPEDATLLRLLGGLEAETGELPAAETTIGRLLALVPDDTEALDMMGRILVMSGRPGEALEPLRKAHELDSGSPQIQADLARAFQAQGDTTSANPLWRKVLATTPEGHPLNLAARESLGYASASAASAAQEQR